MDGQNQNTGSPSARDESTSSDDESVSPLYVSQTPPPSSPSVVAMPYDTPLPIATATPPAAIPLAPSIAPIANIANTASAPVSSAQTPKPTEPAPVSFYNDDSSTRAVDVPVAATGFEEPLIAEDESKRQEVSWMAAEFAPHPKTRSWYLILAGITLVSIALTYLVTRDIITVVVLIVCAGLFGYAASRQPRQMEYALDPKGISVGHKFYPYVDFRSFSIVELGEFSSIDFMPLKRFAPMLSISYDHNNEPEILEILTQHLPFANHARTIIDQLMHRIGF